MFFNLLIQTKIRIELVVPLPQFNDFLTHKNYRIAKFNMRKLNISLISK